jgi:lysine decarboxylase
LAHEGHELFAKAVEEARRIEQEIDALPGMKVFRVGGEERLAGHRRDPLRVVVNVSGTGWSGYEVERYLRTEYRVEDEMSDWFNVVYILSPGDDGGATGRLLAGLRDISTKHRTGAGTPRHGEFPATRLADVEESHLLQPPVPQLAMSPRAAALGRKTTVDLDSAAGRTCAEMVMFYPPGIPLLMPGEMVTRETIDVCRRLLAAGAHPYASDTTLETIRVVD